MLLFLVRIAFLTMKYKVPISSSFSHTLPHLLPCTHPWQAGISRKTELEDMAGAQATSSDSHFSGHCVRRGQRPLEVSVQLLMGVGVGQCLGETQLTNLLMAPKERQHDQTEVPICGFPEMSFFLQHKHLLISLALISRTSIPCSVCKAPGTMTLYFSFFLYFPLFLTIFLKSLHNHLKLNAMTIGIFIPNILYEDSNGRICRDFISADPP